MHVDLHAIPLVAADDGRHDHERVLADEVADAALLFGVLAARVRDHLELERLGRAREQQYAAEALQERALGRHCRARDWLMGHAKGKRR